MTRLFRIDFLLYTRSIFVQITLTIFISNFSLAGPQGENCISHNRALPPNHPNPETLRSPYQLPITPHQGKNHIELLRSRSPHTTGGTFTLHFMKYFLHALTLLLIYYLHEPLCPYHPLNAVIQNMDDIEEESDSISDAEYETHGPPLYSHKERRGGRRWNQ